MLEWYRAGADSEAMLRDTVDLVRAVAAALPSSGPGARARPAVEGLWVRLTVSEAFRRWAGWDPAESWDADRFDLDLVDCVEPQLPRDVPVVLCDYPAPAAALARLRPENPAVAERWELYLGGLEIANAYTELTDPDEQRRRFEQCARDRRALGKDVYPLDEPFLAALAEGMPPSGGIALGVDRLVMALTGAPTMDAVRAFGAERLP
jgi:lysyl-tRNA synthetase class 2